MLEKPDLPDEAIRACLRAAYGLKLARLDFLPVGWQHTAAWRVVADDGVSYFVKLIRGALDEAAVMVPKFLSDHGILQIIAPLPTGTGRLWAGLDDWQVIVYPFVEGHDGYQVALSDGQCVEIGRAVKAIHAAALPPALVSRIQQESYAPKWRELLAAFLQPAAGAGGEAGAFADPVAVEAAALLEAGRGRLLALIARAARLAQVLQAQSPPLVLCHSDLHAGNFLIDAHDALYIVDWDNPVLAPKERDLMFIGGGYLGAARSPQAEAAQFYLGYGQTRVDPVALAYYRYARIIEDIAIDCEQIFLAKTGGADRAQALRYLKSYFLPGGVIDIACQSVQMTG